MNKNEFIFLFFVLSKKFFQIAKKNETFLEQNYLLYKKLYIELSKC